jgi:CHAT domain-containing protein/tetratricopeptide (TPR) repeat protein
MTARERTLLDDLGARPVEAVAADLRRRSDLDEAILAAADDCDRLAISDLVRAVAATESLVSLADIVQHPIPRARARRSRAQALAYANRFDEALSNLSEAIILAEAAGAPVEAARARMTTLHALARLGRLDEAIATGMSARAAFELAGEALLAARADINLGVTFRMKDEPRVAVEHFARARPVVSDQPMLLAQLGSNTAEALLDMHEFDAAEAAFTEALSAFEKSGVQRGAAIVEGNLADLAARRGQIAPAIQHFEQARRRFGDQAPGDLSRVIAEQAEAMAGAGMHAEAVAQFQAAIPILIQHQMVQEASRALAALGGALVKLHRIKEAGEALLQAAALFESLSNQTGMARVRVAQADVALISGDAVGAATLLQSAAALLLDRPADVAAIKLRLAMIAVEGADLAGAEREVDAAVATAQHLTLAPLLADALHCRAKIRFAQGRAAEGVTDLQDAIAQVERSRSLLQAGVFRAAFLADRVGIYQDLTTALLDRGDSSSLAEAFLACERARGRTLLDQIHGAPSDGASEANEHESRLLADLNRELSNVNALYSRFDQPGRTPTTPAALEAWRAALGHHERQVAEIERRLAATSRFAGVYGQPVGAVEILTDLGDEAAMIEFFAEGDALSAFVLRGRSLEVRRRFAPLQHIRENVQALYFQIGRAIARGLAPGPAMTRLAHDCREELLKLGASTITPIDDLLRGASQLVVVPHGALHAVPFQAVLITRAAAPTPAVYQVPSAGIFRQLKRRARSDSVRGPVLIVGVQDSVAPQVLEESQRLAGTIRGSTLLSSSDATVSRFRELARGASVIHIATHARFSRSDPSSSGIRLADGWLTAREFLTLDLSGAWVTLSGCDTGRAAIDSANEVLGLVRSILVAGARGVVMSLWPVHDQTTSEIMASVGASGYSQGVGPASALLRAQETAHRTAAHPAGWAPFIVVGAP